MDLSVLFGVLFRFFRLQIVTLKSIHELYKIKSPRRCLGLFIAVKCVKSQNHPPFYTMKCMTTLYTDKFPSCDCSCSAKPNFLSLEPRNMELDSCNSHLYKMFVVPLSWFRLSHYAVLLGPSGNPDFVISSGTIPHQFWADLSRNR